LLYAVHERVLEREEEEFRARLAEVDWDSLTLEDTIRTLMSIKSDLIKGTEKLYEAFVVSGATDRLIRQRGYRNKATEEDMGWRSSSARRRERRLQGGAGGPHRLAAVAGGA
jgi:hypothetical protein